MCRLPPVSHPRTLTTGNIRLSARSVSARPGPRAVLTLRVTRGPCGARLGAIHTLMSPGPDLGAAEAVGDPEPPANTWRSRRRTAPWRSSRMAARTDPLREPAASSSPSAGSIRPIAEILPARELARERAPRGAGLRLILVVTPRASSRKVDHADHRCASSEDPEVNRQRRPRSRSSPLATTPRATCFALGIPGDASALPIVGRHLLLPNGELSVRSHLGEGDRAVPGRWAAIRAGPYIAEAIAHVWSNRRTNAMRIRRSRLTDRLCLRRHVVDDSPG